MKDQLPQEMKMEVEAPLNHEEEVGSDTLSRDWLHFSYQYHNDIFSRLFTRTSNLKAAGIGLVSLLLSSYALVMGVVLAYLTVGAKLPFGLAPFLWVYSAGYAVSFILALIVLFPRLSYHELAFHDDEFEIHCRLTSEKLVENNLHHLRTAISENWKTYEKHRGKFKVSLQFFIGSNIILVTYIVLRVVGVIPK